MQKEKNLGIVAQKPLALGKVSRSIWAARRDCQGNQNTRQKEGKQRTAKERQNGSRLREDYEMDAPLVVK